MANPKHQENREPQGEPHTAPSYSDSDIIVTSDTVRAVVPDLFPAGTVLDDSGSHGFVASAFRGMVSQHIASSHRAALVTAREAGKSLAERQADLAAYVSTYKFEPPRSRGNTVGAMRRKIAEAYVRDVAKAKGQVIPDATPIEEASIDKAIASTTHGPKVAALLHAFITAEVPREAKVKGAPGAPATATVDLD